MRLHGLPIRKIIIRIWKWVLIIASLNTPPMLLMAYQKMILFVPQRWMDLTQFKFLILSLLLTGCAAKSPLIYIPQHEPPATHLAHIHPRIILVLGSGSARGFAHAGVLAVL